MDISAPGNVVAVGRAQKDIVTLVSFAEGASWIHVVEAASGRSLTFPDAASNENWLVQPATLVWTGPRSFTVAVARCAGCAAAREQIRF